MDSFGITLFLALCSLSIYREVKNHRQINWSLVGNFLKYKMFQWFPLLKTLSAYHIIRESDFRCTGKVYREIKFITGVSRGKSIVIEHDNDSIVRGQMVFGEHPNLRSIYMDDNIPPALFCKTPLDYTLAGVDGIKRNEDQQFFDD